MLWTTPTRNGVTHTKEYNVWQGMKRRCRVPLGNNKVYEDCVISELFKDFDYFAAWCNLQKGFNHVAWDLDKDILVKGNKDYAPTTCCFVPKALNSLLTYKKRNKGLYPVGVNFRKKTGRYIAQLNVEGVKQHLGCFDTPEEAFLAYKKAKEAYIKIVAFKWKDQIDNRVYEALMKWEINIDD